MPVYQELVNYDRMIAQLKEAPILINDFDNVSEESKERIKNVIMTNYTTSDMLSILPSCQCGACRGEFSIGEICETCNTPVKSNVIEDIEPLVWFKAPDGIRKLINPTVLNMLRDRFSISGFKIVSWLCDTSYRPAVKQPKLIEHLQEVFSSMGIKRGYNSFVDNFDTIMDVLFAQKQFKPKTKHKVKTKKNTKDYLRMLLNDYKDCIFSDYIPLPNKSLIIIERTNKGIYINPIIVSAINAIEMINGIDSEFHAYSDKVKENRTIRAITELADYYRSFNASELSGKSGIFRKHVFGARGHFSFRAVITSITKPHRYDEIEVPWVIGLTAFREHLLNKLLKMGFDTNNAIGFIYGHVGKYNRILDQLLQELLDEAPNGRIPCIIQRNPSLLNGSAQLMGICKFKTDPNDLSIGFPILSVKAPNADFDGDELNVTIGLDKHITKLWYGLSPHKNVFMLTKPRSISNNISIPKPVIAAISNFLDSKKGYHFTEQQIANFNSLPSI